MTVLKAAHANHPNDRQLLWTLATISGDHGELQEAMTYAQKLVELSPTDVQAQRLLKELRK